MNAKLETHLVDWDYDGPEALEPRTPVEVLVLSQKIEVELTGDTELGATYRRAVVIEMQQDDGLRVMIYGFDVEQPRVFCVRTDGSIAEKI